MILTTHNTTLPKKSIRLYMRSLIDRFFKILPMKEELEPSLYEYMNSFLRELLGMQKLIVTLSDEPMFLSLLSILKYLIDNPTCEESVVRTEVFHAISICKKLAERYSVTDNGVIHKYADSEKGDVHV